MPTAVARLAKERDIMQVYRRGVPASSAHLSLKAYKLSMPTSRLAVVMSKKVDKRAVVRNRNRRRLRPLLVSQIATESATYDIVVTVRQSIGDMPHAELTREVQQLWQRLMRKMAPR